MRRLSALTVSIFTVSLLAAGASAGTLNVNDTRLNAMGGAGAASSDRLNPALISPVRASNDLEVNLAAATFYVEDPQGFANKLQTFVEEDLDTYQDFDLGQISDSLNALTTALSETAGATSTYAEAVDQYNDDFKNDPSTANTGPVDDAFNALESAGDEQTAAISGMATSINNYDSLARDTQDTLNGLSSRPLNFGLMTSLGLRLPRGGAPFALSLSNNTYGGAELLLEEDDLSGFRQAIEDIQQYNGRLDNIDQDEFAAVVSAADALNEEIAKGEDADPDTLEELLKNLNDPGDPNDENDPDTGALADFKAAQAKLESLNTDNGLFVNGEFDEDADILKFEAEVVEILGANITEVALGTGYDFPNDLGNLSVGAVGKLQFIMVFGQSVGVENVDAIDADTLMDDVEGYVAGNVDLGVSQTFPDLMTGTLAVGAVVKDLIPYSLEAANGREISIGPKVRAGVSHYTPYTLVSVDLDVTENDPVGYGSASRYLGFGMEFNAWDWANIRGGYRNNLALDDASVISAGLGFTPWAASVEVSAWTKPNPGNDIDLLLNSGLSADVSLKF